MSYTVPTLRSTGDLITASIYNTDLVNNIIAIQGGLVGYGFTVLDLAGAGSDPSVSTASHAVLAYNTATGSIRSSLNGGAFADLGTPPNSADAIFAKGMLG